MTERGTLSHCILLILALVALSLKAVQAQEEPPIVIDTTLLNVPVFVNDRSGEVVQGLTKEDFDLFVNGRKQRIDFFASKSPVSIAIIIDANSNTREVIDRIRRDAQELVALLGPEDRAMVVRLDIGYKVVCELSSDKGQLRRAIGGIDTHRDRVRTMDFTLHQVIYRELAEVSGKKAVVVFGDPDSAISWYNLKLEPSDFFRSDFLESSDTPVFPIFYQTSSFPREFTGKTLTLDQLMKVPPVRNFYYYAILTGGRFYAAGATDFKIAFPRLIEDIRHQYLLGIHLDADAGKINDLTVKLSRPGLVLRTKAKIKAVNSEERRKWVDRFLAAQKSSRY